MPLLRQLRASSSREADTVAPPQAEAIARHSHSSGWRPGPRDVGYALVLLFALCIELMAAFGASWCGVHLPRSAAGQGLASGARQPLGTRGRAGFDVTES